MSFHLNNQNIEEAWPPLISKLTTCGTESERQALISEMTSGTKPQIVSFLNAHACNLAAKNAEFHDILTNSDYLLRDGVGIELHLLLRGRKPGINLNGTDLIPDIIAHVDSQGKGKISLYGTKFKHVTSAREALANHNITVDIMDGFRPDEEYVERALASRPNLIILGMGMPKQEILSLKLRAELGTSSVLIVNGGAIIDFIAGSYPRAPNWIRRIRLESLYRLSHEPRRLWRRNIGSIKFLKRSVCSAWNDRNTQQ